MDDMNLKQRILGFLIPFIHAIFWIRFLSSIKTSLNEHCRNKKNFAALGGDHQRNVITLSQTAWYLSYSFCFIAADNIIIIICEIYQKELSKETIFIIHNMLWVFVVDIFFGLYLPLKHLALTWNNMPSLWFKERNLSNASPFYIKEPELTPRRNSFPIVYTCESIWTKYKLKDITNSIKRKENHNLRKNHTTLTTLNETYNKQQNCTAKTSSLVTIYE